MGRSAKLHKRVKKATASSNTPQQHAIPDSEAKPKPMSSSVQSAKKRADLKSKANLKGKQSKSVAGEHVLGDADYVTLLLGGRRKAAQEALKMPVDSE